MRTVKVVPGGGGEEGMNRQSTEDFQGSETYFNSAHGIKYLSKPIECTTPRVTIR